jgi:hypothetical protein
VENRIGEPAANPYLYMAANIAAGLDGIRRGLDVAPVEADPYAAQAPMLPTSLEDAVTALEKDDFYPAPTSPARGPAGSTTCCSPSSLTWRRSSAIARTPFTSAFWPGSTNATAHRWHLITTWMKARFSPTIDFNSARWPWRKEVAWLNSTGP